MQGQPKKREISFGTVTMPDFAKVLVNSALNSGNVTCGQLVAQLEQMFARRFKQKYAVGVSSGTSALEVALASLYDCGAQPGDKIIVPALSFIATANAVLAAGFIPEFVDIDLKTLCLDPTKLEARFDMKLLGIIPVHLMGKPCDMTAIMQYKNIQNLWCIEDCCEAHGALVMAGGQWQSVGTFGEMSCYSMYAAHIVSCVEGGFVTTDNEAFAETCRSVRNHGRAKDGWTFDRFGFNAKMNEMEAGVGIGNMMIFEETWAKRKRNWLLLTEHLKKYEDRFIMLEEDVNKEVIAPHAFSMIVREGAGFTKDQFVAYLHENGIDSRNLFYSMPTQCKHYRARFGYQLGQFPNAEYASDHGLHIGIHQGLTADDMHYVIEKIGEFLK